MKAILLLLLSLFALPACAQWPVSLHWNGVSLGYPKIAPDGHNGVFVAGSQGAYDTDVYLFHVDSTGRSLWDEADSSYVSGAGGQYALEIYADGSGGCVLLVDDEVSNFPDPARDRIRIVRFDASGHPLWSYMPYDTSAEHYYSFGTMAVVNDQVDIFWWSEAPDSVGGWFTRLRLSDGTAMDEPGIRYFSQNAAYASKLKGSDSLYLNAADSIFVLNPTSGLIHPIRACVSLSYPKMIWFADTLVIYGLTSNASFVIERLSGTNEVRIDTISATISTVVDWGGSIFNNQIAFGYGYNWDVYFRLLANVGLSETVTVCDASGSQSRVGITSGSDGFGEAWIDQRSGNQVYIQQIENGACRWPNGLAIGTGVDPVTHGLDACNGDRFGYAVVAWNGLEVYPIDSLPRNAVPERPVGLPTGITLSEPYPNPFNGSVQVQFELARTSRIALSLHNVLGQKVAILADKPFTPGMHTLNYENELASGVYLLCLRTDYGTQTKKLVVMK